MVRQDHQAEIIIILEDAQQLSNYIMVKSLDGGDLFLQIPDVPCLIRGLHMHEYEVLVLEGLCRCLCFGLVIRVVVAGSSGNIDDLKTEQLAHTLEQIYCCNDATCKMVFLEIGWQIGRSALSPEPNHVSWTIARFDTHLIGEGAFQNVARSFHQLHQGFASAAARPMFGRAFSHDVVRRKAVYVQQIWLSVSYDQQVSIAHAAVELNVISAQLSIQGFDQLYCLFC
jgi:hypothetical protein